MGDSLTCGTEAIPVLVRPCSLIALRADLYLPPLQAICAASVHSALSRMSSNARAPWDESCSPVPATISRAPRNPFMALLMDPRGQVAGSFPALIVCL